MKYSILVSDNILIFSLLVGCFYRKVPALKFQYLKASAHSFKRFTSRPFLKISFSLSMHLLHVPRINVMLDFI